MLLIHFLLLFWSSVTCYDGYAVHYSPGVMERVAQYRDLPQEDCMVSTPYTDNIGSWVIVESPYATLQCQITDVSHPRDKARHIRTGTAAELSFEAAKRLCHITRVAEKSKYECPVKIYILEGFIDNER